MNCLQQIVFLIFDKGGSIGSYAFLFDGVFFNSTRTHQKYLISAYAKVLQKI